METRNVSDSAPAMSRTVSDGMPRTSRRRASWLAAWQTWSKSGAEIAEDESIGGLDRERDEQVDIDPNAVRGRDLVAGRRERDLALRHDVGHGDPRRQDVNAGREGALEAAAAQGQRLRPLRNADHERLEDAEDDEMTPSAARPPRRARFTSKISLTTIITTPAATSSFLIRLRAGQHDDREAPRGIGHREGVGRVVERHADLCQLHVLDPGRRRSGGLLGRRDRRYLLINHGSSPSHFGAYTQPGAMPGRWPARQRALHPG